MLRDFKRVVTLILILALSLFALIALSACNDKEEPEESDKPEEPTLPENPQEPEFPEDGEELDGLVLIKKNIAQFKVVIAQGAGAAGRRAANSLVDTLEKLGVEISDAIEDKDAIAVGDCEIIIGTGVRNRPEECRVTADYLGEDGYVIKAVGNRVVIAGGTADLTKSAVEEFIKNHLGITDATESLRNKSISETLKVEVLTDYQIDSLKISNYDISEFSIVCDQSDSLVYPGLVTTMQTAIKELTGKRLAIVDEKSSGQIAHKIVIRSIPYSTKNGVRTYDDGFYAYCKSGSLYIECEYSNAFVDTYQKFISEYITSQSGNVVFPSDFSHSYHVSTVTYCTYGGAKGDGVTNDIEAIIKTHDYANLGGQKVIADSGKKFYISDTNIGTLDKTKILSATIKTDTDFGDAIIYIDDNWNNWGENTSEKTEAYRCRNSHIFYIKSDYEAKVLKAAQITALNSGVMPVVKANTKSLPWLKSELSTGAMLLLKNDDKKDYIRFGGNFNSGSGRAEVILVDADGNVDESTPITFDFDSFTSITIYRTDDKPITVEGGKFITESNLVSADTNNENKCTYWKRGIGIQRSNAIVRNIDHKMVGEPAQVANKDDDTFNQAYPYCWINIEYNCNVRFEDCDLTGHRVYREDERDRSGSVTDMGTYDFDIQYTVNVTVKGITQSKTDFRDSAFWGITGSNWSRNMTFEKCTISRFDAHCGFWNATIKDCHLGSIINVIGGGRLEIINTKRYMNDAFITLRGDYGATFNGDIYIKNCELLAIKSFNSTAGQAFDATNVLSTGYVIKVNQLPSNGVHEGTGANFYTHDFGYTCYMPQNIILDNYVSRATNTYFFSDLDDRLFVLQGTTDNGVYELPKSITYKNMNVTYSLTRNPTKFTKIAGLASVVNVVT